MLDVGPSDGVALQQLAHEGNAGLFVATGYYSRIEGNVEFAKADLEKALPFEENSFDCIICTDEIDHIESKNQLAREIARVSPLYVNISLPNPKRKSYVGGLKRGNMSGKNIFDVEDGVDRRRWVTFYEEKRNLSRNTIGLLSESISEISRIMPSLHAGTRQNTSEINFLHVSCFGQVTLAESSPFRATLRASEGIKPFRVASRFTPDKRR